MTKLEKTTKMFLIFLVGVGFGYYWCYVATNNLCGKVLRDRYNTEFQSNFSLNNANNHLTTQNILKELEIENLKLEKE